MQATEAVENCGIVALKGILDVKNISMFTLIHLARDNGMKFYFCKVDVGDLVSIPRPAILHSHDHFILIEDNKPLPDAEYTGWVLSSKPTGMTLPYSLAKQISGGKKGSSIIGSILPVVGAIVGNIIAPGIGGIIGGALAGGGGAALRGEKGLGIGIGALTGGLGGIAPGSKFLGMDPAMLAGGLGAAGALPGAIKSGNYGGVLSAGLGGYAGQKLAAGGAAGAAMPSTGLGNRASNIFGGAVGNLTGQTIGPSKGSQLLQSGGGVGINGSGAMNMAPGSNLAIGSSSLGSGNFSGAGALAGATGSSSAISSMTQPASGGTKGVLGSLFGNLDKDAILKAGAGALAGTAFPRPELTSADAVGNYDKASKFLEGKTLPGHTNEQLNRYLGMSIQDIQGEILGPQAANRSMLELDKKYQESLADVQRRAANSGQSVDTSSDARKQFDEINRQWGEAKSNLWGELEQKAREQAIGVHQWALQQSIAVGQFDSQSAMTLAQEMGKGQQLQDAITQNNYEAFQNLIAELLTGKQGMQNPNAKQNPNSIVINMPQQMATANTLGGLKWIQLK